MVKGASMPTPLQHNDWKETAVRWGIERRPMVLLHQVAVVALIFTMLSTELLAPVYEWFTEGFDTADLKDAKALLEELA